MSWYDSRKIKILVEGRQASQVKDKGLINGLILPGKMGDADFKYNVGSDLGDPEDCIQASELLRKLSRGYLYRGWNLKNSDFGDTISEILNTRLGSFEATGNDVPVEHRSIGEKRKFQENNLEPQKVLHLTPKFEEAWDYTSNYEKIHIIAGYQPEKLVDPDDEGNRKEQRSRYLSKSDPRKAVAFLLEVKLKT